MPSTPGPETGPDSELEADSEAESDTVRDRGPGPLVFTAVMVGLVVAVMGVAAVGGWGGIIGAAVVLVVATAGCARWFG